MRDVPVDLGAPYQSWQWLPLEQALQRHSYASDHELLLLVPVVSHEQLVTALRALRFDVSSGRWQPEASHVLHGHPRLAPRYTELVSGPVRDGHAVAWTDRVSGARQGVVFASAQGSFRATGADELRSVPARDGLATHPAYPPNPEPTSGVSISVDYPGASATFSRGATLLGTIRFPSIPGAYVAAFPKTGTAFFWDGSTQPERDTYLVGLETGATCRVARELAYPATAVFRRPRWLAFVNALRSEEQRSNCPPGAPCVAPQPSRFAGASLVVFEDRGP